MKSTSNCRLARKVLAGIAIGTSFFWSVTTITPVLASSNPMPLFWQSMDTAEAKDIHVPVEMTASIPAVPASSQGLSSEQVLHLVATLQQQQQQNMAMVIAALQPKQQTADTSVLLALQQQQQQNMIILLAAMQQNRVDPSTVVAASQQQQKQMDLVLKLLKPPDKESDYSLLSSPFAGNSLGKDPTDNRFITITPTSADPVPEAVETPKQRARLAPPDEPVRELSPSESISEAIQDAALEGYYRDSMAVFNYGDASLYKIYCKEGYLTVLRFQPGETIVSINGGDTTRWILDSTTAGTGPTSLAQVMLKPVRSGLDTNFVIVTDKHTYQIQAKSTSWYNPIVSWTYPQETRDAMYRVEEKRIKNDKETIELTNSKPEQLHFNYKISTKGDVDSWKPRTVFDDGKKVYIKMTDTMKYGDAPALILRDKKGKAILVNYRLKNEYYIVDRLFDEAELRIGTKDYVRIKRVADKTGEE